MKKVILAIAFFVMPSVAMASDGGEGYWMPFVKDAAPKVKSGYQVKGCKDYYIGQKDGRVHQVCSWPVGSNAWWFTTGYRTVG